MIHNYQLPFGNGNDLKVEIGKVAKQAHASIWASWGDTVVLAAMVFGPDARGVDYFPLFIDYRDKMYADGRIPGSFFRREGRPTDHETLKARIVDRPLRPLFPDHYRDEVQIFLNTYSVDQEHVDYVISVNAASLALLISACPFTKPVGCVRVGRIDGELKVNPTISEMKTSDVDLLVAGTKDAINMVECGSNFVEESVLIDGLRLAHDKIQEICAWQESIRAEIGQPKIEVLKPEINEEVFNEAVLLAETKLEPVYAITEKVERSDKLDACKQEICDAMLENLGEEAYTENLKTIIGAIDTVYKKRVRLETLKGNRTDGRDLKEIRPITVEAGTLPRAHGSGLFTRGQTQSLGVCTLGTKTEQMLIDDIRGVYDRHYFLHYNFPGWSVGEVRPARGPGRREIGHGNLAEKSIEPVLPEHPGFPYTIRLVSEILESNGSSSMASVCSCCLALMDCGVPIKAPVAGIAMGLIMDEESGKYVVLSDIAGIEDHLGDMDFKVAGTKDGVTALQMDIKIEGVTIEIMEKALAQAKEGRLHILGKMTDVLAEPRPELSKWAPRMEQIKIPQDKIGALIGPGGKNIREICETTKCKIDVEEDGTVILAGVDGEMMKLAIKLVEQCTAVPEAGKIYTGKVRSIQNFGIFVEILPGIDGMCHISELVADRRLECVEEFCSLGDTVTVKCTDVDSATGKTRLSRTEALKELGELNNETLNPSWTQGDPLPKRDDGRGGRGGGGNRGGGRDRDRGGRGGRGGGGGRR
ncbi:polyribonucleotide nucleotidyltransferase [Candidatus Sumerlaeota bacterium]|nr:polyribonucleotide nucleotidyltransferase [Candidatus Sumerlaeota bacterium]